MRKLKTVREQVVVSLHECVYVQEHGESDPLLFFTVEITVGEL